jgi:hypothetical protein
MAGQIEIQVLEVVRPCTADADRVHALTNVSAFVSPLLPSPPKRIALSGKGSLAGKGLLIVSIDHSA